MRLDLQSAGMVSMFPFIDDRLYRVEGGNYRLAVELLKYASARLQCPAEVAAVKQQNDGRWQLQLASSLAGMCAAGQVKSRRQSG